MGRLSFVRGVCTGGLLASSLLIGCAAEEAPWQGASGDAVASVSVELDMASDIGLTQIGYQVMRGQSELRSGTMALTGDGSAPMQGIIDGLPVGRVDIVLAGLARNGFWCNGRSPFTIRHGRGNALAMRLNCGMHGGAGGGAGGAGGQAPPDDCDEPDSGNGNGNGNGGTNGGMDAGHHMDAGVDAGVDAGMDAGGEMDAGVDAGVDAGMDAGVDAGVDAGMDAGEIDAGTDAGPAPPPSICDEPADDCDDCACTNCAPQLDACEHATGVAMAGPAAGTSRATLCMAFMRCAQDTGCEGVLCYCGPGVDLGSCLGGGAFGACLEEMENAAETEVPTTLIGRQSNNEFAIGLATTLLNCTEDACPLSCD